jgi:hypothetical protein
LSQNYDLQDALQYFPAIDADTGDEIIVFQRRGTLYIYLRRHHPIQVMTRTGRVVRLKPFIRRLRRIRLTVALVFKYTMNMAKRKNPLYVDIIIETNLDVTTLGYMSYAIRRMSDIAKEIVSEYFNPVVAGLMEPKDLNKERKLVHQIMAGVEIGSEPAKYDYNMAYWKLIWHHYKPQEIASPKTEEGVEYI